MMKIPHTPPLISAGLIEAGLIEAGLIEAGLIEAGLIAAGLIAAGLIAITPLLAPAATAAPILGVEAALSQVSVNADYMSQSYHETNNSSNGAFDRELGTIPGGSVDIGYLASPRSGLDDLYLGGSFQYNDGNVNYHGTTIDGTMPINDTTQTRIENGEIEFGKGFYVGSADFMLVPTVFWGQRDWNRDLVGDAEVEDYRTSRIGVALHAALGLTSRLTAFGRIGVGDTLSPDMQLTSDGSAIKFRQGSEPVGEAEVGMDYLFFANWHLRAAGDINSFTYGQSNAVAISSTEELLEPSSSTTDVSVKIGLGWSFP